MTKHNIAWITVYAAVAALSLVCYFSTRLEIAYFQIWPITISNFSLNYLLLMLTWGAASPVVLARVFPKMPFLLRWLVVLLGFVLLLVILTLGGLHTRLTDWFGGVK